VNPIPKVTDNRNRRVAVNVIPPVRLLEQVDQYVAERGLSRWALIRDLLGDAMDIAVSEERPKELHIPWETVKAEAGSWVSPRMHPKARGPASPP